MVKQTKLQRQFQAYNEKYFAGKLPTIRVKWTKSLCKETGALACCNGKLIQVDPRIKWIGRFVGAMLLHEMAHLKFISAGRYDVQHGPKFKKEIKRLMRAGAFDRLLW